MEKDKSFYELVVSVGVALLSCYFLYTAFTTIATAPPRMMSAMDFPKTILFGILALSLYLAIRNLFVLKRKMASGRERARTDPRVWISVGLIVVYALAWKYVSFSIATLAYIFVQAKVLDHELKWRNCFFVSLLATAIVLVIFRVVFKVSLNENLLVTLGILY